MKNIYFASDFHLGIDTHMASKEREKVIVQWLEEIRKDASHIYLLGDVLDYWFEYNSTVPKGFTRLFGKLAELTDQGITIEWVTGNHDMWTFGYIENELGIKVHKKPILKMINGKNCYLCHGDGLGKGDFSYKIIKTIISNPICQFLFSLIPSRIGMWLMTNSSKGSRHSQNHSSQKEKLKDQNLHDHFESIAKTNQIDYFIYGHLHHGKTRTLSNGQSQSINLGDWTSMWTYGVMTQDGHLELKKYDGLK